MPRSAIVSTGTSGRATSPTASRMAALGHHVAPGCERAHVLQLGQQVAQVLGVLTHADHRCAGTTPTAERTWIRRSLPVTRRVPLVVQRRRIHCDGADVVRGRRTRTSPRCKARAASSAGLHPAVALLGPVAQPQHPLGRVVDVVRDLLDRLARDTPASISSAHVRSSSYSRCWYVAKYSNRAIACGEVAVRQLAQLAVAELALVPEVGQLVLVRARALDLTGVRQQRPGLAELVERDVGQRDVLFDLRARPRSTRPCAGRRSARRRRAGACRSKQVVHRCSTPSGTW